MNIFKNFMVIILLVLISACGSNKSSSNQGQPTEPESIFNIKTYNISKGDTVKLNYRQVDSTGAVISFVSNNSNVAKVNNNGEVTGESAGTAQIEISITTSGITQKDVCTVNVIDDIITYIGYASKEQVIAVNETITPKLIILPESAKDNTITYEITDALTASVDNNTGAVTGLKVGSTVLTATTVGNLSSSINIIVKESVKHVTEISLLETSKTITQGEKYQIVPTVLPADADNKNVTYSSSDKNVAVVLPDGTVVGENPGNAVITVETVDGNKTATLNITVQEATSPLELIEIGDVILEAGTSKFVNVNVTPANAKYSNLKITTSNDAVTVTPVTRTTLLVTAKKQGYLTGIDVEAENCVPKDTTTTCTGVFNTFTIDNETAKLPETLLTVEPYNYILEDATNYKIKVSLDNTSKLYPVNAIKRYPENSKVESTQWDILLPADSTGHQPLVKHDDNSVSAQALGKAVMVVGILGHDEIKPVIFDVEVVAQDSQIQAVDKHCEISSIEISNEAELISKLSKVGTLEPINANINYNQGTHCYIRIYDYNVETSDKNIIDIIDNTAYVKKTGNVTLTIVPNTIYAKDNMKKEIQITVTE